MNKFILTTDTSCDMRKTELNAANVPYIPLTYTINGITKEDNFSLDSEYKEFYDQLRAGAMPITSQINAFLHQEFFEKVLESGDSIVHLALSSGLSATYYSAVEAAKEVEKKTGKKVFVIDSKAATQAARCVLDYGIALRDDGRTASETATLLEECVRGLKGFALVDDLFHLYRGGRVSGAAAYIGSALKVKPIITLDKDGKLPVIEKVMGTRKGIKRLVEKVGMYLDEPQSRHIFIGHADNLELAKELEEEVVKKYHCKTTIGWVGPIIGSHTGAGVVMLSSTNCGK